MLVAIHQPNFLPWAGYFLKIARADRFILLDDAAVVRTGGSYANRVALPAGARPGWCTVPLLRPHGTAPALRDARIDDRRPWRRRLLARLEATYRKAPGFGEVAPLLAPLLASPEDHLAPFNEALLVALAARLGIPPERFVRASDLAVGGSGTGRLVRLVAAVGGTAYLHGAGAVKYQDDRLFAEAGIRLVRAPVPPPLPAATACAPSAGLSIVDPLMAAGFAAVGEILRG